jgi:hypothetical protein
MSGSSWPIVLGLITLVIGAVWYDAQNANAATPPQAPPQMAQAASK